MNAALREKLVSGALPANELVKLSNDDLAVEDTRSKRKLMAEAHADAQALDYNKRQDVRERKLSS